MGSAAIPSELALTASAECPRLAETGAHADGPKEARYPCTAYTHPPTETAPLRLGLTIQIVATRSRRLDADARLLRRDEA